MGLRPRRWHPSGTATGGRSDRLRQPLPGPAPGLPADRCHHRGGAEHGGRDHRPRGIGRSPRIGTGGAGLDHPGRYPPRPGQPGGAGGCALPASRRPLFPRRLPEHRPASGGRGRHRVRRGHQHRPQVAARSAGNRTALRPGRLRRPAEPAGRRRQRRGVGGRPSTTPCARAPSASSSSRFPSPPTSAWGWPSTTPWTLEWTPSPPG